MCFSAKTILCVIAISMVIGNSRLRGDVYTTSVTLNVVNSQGGISATTQPNHGGDGAILGLAIDGSLVLRPTSYSVGIGHVWYSVTPGTVIDPAFAMTAPRLPMHLQEISTAAFNWLLARRIFWASGWMQMAMPFRDWEIGLAGPVSPITLRRSPSLATRLKAPAPGSLREPPLLFLSLHRLCCCCLALWQCQRHGG